MLLIQNLKFFFQVAIPALHVSLGCFLKFFNMLEAECYHIDFDMAVTSGEGKGLTEEQVKAMKDAFDLIRKCEDDMVEIEHTISLIHQAIASHMAENPTNEKEIRKVYEPRLAHFTKLFESKVTYFSNFLITYMLKMRSLDN